MNVTSNTNSRKRSAFVEVTDQKELSKKQRLNDNEKENAHIGAGNLQDTYKVSSNVGLATVQKKNTADANKCEIRISSVSSSSSHQARPSNLASKIQQWEHQQEQAPNKTTSLLMKTNTPSDNKQSGKFQAKPFMVSQKEQLPKKNAELKSIPVSSRKAFFEQTSSEQHITPSESTSPSKLSFSQRAAMFEKATNNDDTKSQGNVPLPKRVTSAFMEAIEGERKLQDRQKRINISDIKSSGLPIHETTSMNQVEAPTCEEDASCTSYTEHQFTKSKLTGSKQNSKSNIKDNVVNARKPVNPTLHNMCLDTDSFKERSLDVKKTDVHQSVESSIDNTQQAEAVSKVSHGKKLSTLLNRWEKLASSSSLGESYSVESLTSQQEKSDTNACISEGENSMCKSELEWESSEGESTSEWEYIKGESISETPQHQGSLIPEPNEEVPKEVSESEIESMDEETVKSLNTAAIKEKSMNELTASYVTDSNSSPGSTNATNMKEQNWQQKVSSDTQSTTDNSTWNSTPSETNSSHAESLNPKTSPSQTHSNTEPIRSNETEASLKTPMEGTSGNFGSPLVHTVSFYRKQKLGSKVSSPMTPVKRPSSVIEEDDETDIKIRRQIKLLQEEVLKQQTVIGQTCQALNLCYATTEFSGSSEKIEAERLLLIATQKRMACMNEIQYLKSQYAHGEAVAEGTGTLTISDIQLPLKQDFMASQMKGDIDRVHCFLCLIRHGSQVIVTQMASTSDRIMNGALHFYNHIELQNLSSDFSVSFEVYTLQSHKENLSHDKKYHIKREQSKIRLTPKRMKTESKLLRPAISSPGGPDAVRTSNFSLIGYTKFTVQNSNKKCFTLDKVPFSSPLEGILKVNLHLQSKHTTSHKGFLTLFQDISDYGHWSRLWCSLDTHGLSYWKYPDQEEQKKRAMGTIDLRQCVTGHVGGVSRDECARPNTFRIVTVKEVREGDRETLVQRKVDTVMTTKHLLSADTKEERIEWCNKINEALSNIRKWDVQALQPLDDKMIA